MKKRLFPLIMSAIVFSAYISGSASGAILNTTAEDSYEWLLEPSIELEELIVPDYYDGTEGYRYSFCEDCAYAKQNGKYGVIQYDGSFLIEPEYDTCNGIADNGNMFYGTGGFPAVYNYDTGDTVFIRNGNELMLDTQKGVHGAPGIGGVPGDMVYNVEDGYIYNYFYGIESMVSSDPWQRINPDFPLVCRRASIKNIRSNHIDSLGDLYGLADDTKVYVDFQYKHAYFGGSGGGMNGGGCAFEENGKWCIYNSNGEQIIPFVLEPIENNYPNALFWCGTDDGLYNTPFIISDGFVAAKVDDDWGFFNSKGEVAVPFGEFEEVRSVHKGRAWVKKDGLWGVIYLGNGDEFEGVPFVGKSIDSDSDGLPDDWEINGIDSDKDGVIDVDLPAMGADPNVKDIFIEADWMVGKNKVLFWEQDKQNTRPSSRALELVYLSFKLHDINLHIDAGPDSIMNYDTGETWGELSGGNAFTYNNSFDTSNDWGKTIEENFTPSRVRAFRYCLFVTSYNNGQSTGIACDIPGQFFIVSSGIIGDNDITLASTFMHELGHTLGLGHGGVYTGENGETIPVHMNYKPNHLSIMNYTYQLTGLKTIGGYSFIDYQDFELPEINEQHINENDGIDPKGATSGRGFIAKLYVGNTFLWFDGEEEFSDIAKQPIDFNGNGRLEGDVRFDLNPAWTKDTSKSKDYDGCSILTQTENEWEHLQFKAGVIGKTSSGAGIDFNDTVSIDEKNDELSIDEAYELGLLGSKGECQFRYVGSKTLYDNMPDQQLRVNIMSLFPEDTTVALNVSSDVLDSDYYEDVIITGQEALVEIPIKEGLAQGNYDAAYTMTLANGDVITNNGIITVKSPETVKLAIGDSEYISPEFATQLKSSDESVIEVNGSSVTARAAGTAYFSCITANDDQYCVKVDVKAANPITAITDTSSSTSTTFIIVIIIAVAALLIATLLIAALVIILLLGKKRPRTR